MSGSELEIKVIVNGVEHTCDASITDKSARVTEELKHRVAAEVARLETLDLPKNKLIDLSPGGQTAWYIAYKTQMPH